jgi:hypothetical protein
VTFTDAGADLFAQRPPRTRTGLHTGVNDTIASNDDIKLKRKAVLVPGSTKGTFHMVIVHSPAFGSAKRSIHYDNFISVAVCGGLGSWLSSLFARFISSR